MEEYMERPGCFKCQHCNRALRLDLANLEKNFQEYMTLSLPEEKKLMAEKSSKKGKTKSASEGSLEPHIQGGSDAGQFRTGRKAKGQGNNAENEKEAVTRSEPSQSGKARGFEIQGQRNSPSVNKKRLAVDAMNDSYVVLSEPKEFEDSTLQEIMDHKFTFTAKFFNCISSESDMDHPLCQDCTTRLFGELEKMQREAETEFTLYEQASQQEDLQPYSEQEEREVLEELEKLEKLEAELKQAVATVEKEREQIRLETEKLKKDSAVLHAEEQAHLRMVNQLSIDYAEYQAERESTARRYNQACEQLTLLTDTNIVNDAFHITELKNLGTINSFRMGRVSTVTWDEINTAWGQTALLLVTLAKQVNMTFTNYRPVPRGSLSVMESTDGRNTYDLYMTAGPSLFKGSRYKDALGYFTMCYSQLIDYCESIDLRNSLPFSVHRGMIGEHDIRDYTQEKSWNEACRCLLINLKWTIGLIRKMV